MDQPRLCIVGAGRHSTNRIYPYIAPAGARLVGVCDLEQEKAEQKTRLYGGKAYAEMDRMLEEQEPDGVIICIGPKQHAELAPPVMERGIPVYTEKPPAPDAASALQVARVSRRTGVLCTTGFKKRYSNAYSRARQWLDGFEPADCLSLSVDYASGSYGEQQEGHDFLLDFAIHLIDLVGYLFGDAARAFAFTKEREAYGVSMEFANGAVGSMNLTCGRTFGVPTEEVELTVRGANFMTVHNSSCWRITEEGEPTEWREPPTFISAGDSGNETGHLAELVDFVEAIGEGRSTRSSIFESYKSMVLFEAIRESADTGKVVEVTYESV